MCGTVASAGELALCTGWIAIDGGRLPLAWPLYEEARELADGAGDQVLAVHVLTSQSMLHAEMARTGQAREPARQALRLAFQAQEEGRYIPDPRLHALIIPAGLRPGTGTALRLWCRREPLRARPRRAARTR
jgi:hypothetical protein